MDEESIARQREREAAYIAACKAHGIKPELPSYRGAGTQDAAFDSIAAEDEGQHNGRVFRVCRPEPEPLQSLGAAGEAAARILDLIMPIKTDPAAFAQTAGRRALCLAWLLGRRPEPLAELARKLGVTRACLSRMALVLGDAVGIHARGQKRHGTRRTYAANARKSWKLRRLNKALAEAVDAGEN
jgi:hypothetical protein